MSDGHDCGAPEPFRFVVTFRAGVSVWAEVAVTKRQQLLLQFLVDNAGRPVTRQQLLALAYGALDTAALAEDMDWLESELSRTVGSEILQDTPDGGFILAVDKVRLSLPRRV